MATCSAHSRSSFAVYSASVNINHFPLELLISIFSLVVSSWTRANTQFRLAWVCRYWRRIIFEDSKFWTTMSFRSQGSNDPEYRELVLRKSGTRELALFGPNAGDIEFNLAKWIIFREYLRYQTSRIKTLFLDGLYGYPEDDSKDGQLLMERPFSLMNLVFKNLQVLSMVCHDFIPINLQIAVPNLQALQLIIYGGSLPHEFPSHLKKLSLRVPFDINVLKLLIGTKELEYLSILFDDPIHRSYFNAQIKLPNLTTLKSNGSADLVDVLSAPALKHLEIAAPRYSDKTNRRRVCRILDNFDLSDYTHLYIRYTFTNIRNSEREFADRDLQNPIDSCIWASIGPTKTPCLSDQPTIFRGQGNKLTELPSSWSDYGPDDKPLIHMHTVRGYNFTKGSSILPCKLIARMVSLETLVLCFSDTPYPLGSHRSDNDDLEPYHFLLTDIFREIAHPDTGLLHLFIQSAKLIKSSEMLQQLFDEEIWADDSCPLLESITYYAPSESSLSFSRTSHEFWKTWINFIEMRQKCGHPLKLFRTIGAYPPSSGALKKLEKLSKFTKVIIENDNAFLDIGVVGSGF